jgi:hypothetical protein
VAFLILVSATASFMVGSSTLFEQIVKAQNTTTNMTGSVGNMSEKGALNHLYMNISAKVYLLSIV